MRNMTNHLEKGHQRSHRCTRGFPRATRMFDQTHICASSETSGVVHPRRDRAPPQDIVVRPSDPVDRREPRIDRTHVHARVEHLKHQLRASLAHHDDGSRRRDEEGKQRSHRESEPTRPAPRRPSPTDCDNGPQAKRSQYERSQPDRNASGIQVCISAPLTIAHSARHGSGKVALPVFSLRVSPESAPGAEPPGFGATVACCRTCIRVGLWCRRVLPGNVRLLVGPLLRPRLKVGAEVPRGVHRLDPSHPGSTRVPT